jgi:long-chain acyl-CoA synthetase
MPTFYDRFRDCAERWPDNPCLEIQKHEQVESYTYAGIRRMAESIGRWMVENHIERGSRIAILADNHPRWVASYLGIIAAGSVAVPLDTAFHADQVAKLLRDSGATLLFCDDKHADASKEAIASLTISLVSISQQAKATHIFKTSLNEIFAAGPGNFSPVDSAPDDLASLLYTSGTTADPKGVMLTHGNLLAEAQAVFNVIHIGPEDSILGLLPLFHVLSQMANLLLPLISGTRVVYLETLNTTELLRALQERQITIFCVVPQFFNLIHERIFKEAAKRGALARFALRAMMKTNRGLRKLGLNAGKVFFGKIHKIFGPRMRYLVTGGSRFSPEIASDFYDLGIDVLQAYGLTETTGGAFLSPPGGVVIGSVGRALPGVETRIDNPQPNETGDGPSGEIVLRGPIVMKGYWHRDDATQAVLHDGWFRTGDLGRVDTHENLFITGRLKDVIVLSNGKNVYPEEIEAHYMQSPYVKEICVLGLEGSPGDPNSDRLYGVIVPNFDALKERKIVNAKESIRFDIEGLSAKLASTKRLASYEIWQEDLPRTTTRKLKRFEIEKRVRANLVKGVGADGDIGIEKPLSAEDKQWMEEPNAARALAIIRDSARTAPAVIRPDANLELDLGFDSMGRVELLVALEQELGGDVEESRLAEIYSVRELLTAILESASEGKSRSGGNAFAGWENVLGDDSTTDPQILALAKPKRYVEFFWFCMFRIVAFISRVFFRLQVSGLDNLPKDKPFLICSNHQSYIDPLVTGSILPWSLFRRLFAVGTSEIFGSGFMRKLAQSLRVVVVDPDANLIPAMRAGAFGLRHGRVLILYPEGERSIDGLPKTFKKGAAILSIQTQVPIVPVAIEGFHEVWPRGKSFQKLAQLKIKFGEPIFPPPKSDASETAYDKLTEQIKDRVVKMREELI